MTPDKIAEMKRAAEAALKPFKPRNEIGKVMVEAAKRADKQLEFLKSVIERRYGKPEEYPLRPANVLALIADHDALLARAERAEAERDEARSAAEQAYGLLWQISTDDKRVHAARKILLHLVGKDGQRRGIAATRPSPCGHPISLAATGVETGIVTCEFCDTRQQLDDAVSEEARWSARAERAEAKIARGRATIEKMRDEWARYAKEDNPRDPQRAIFNACRKDGADSILAAIKGDDPCSDN